ncbi:amidohydrolase family protein, partial [Streptomyces sp. NPDC055078]
LVTSPTRLAAPSWNPATHEITYIRRNPGTPELVLGDKVLSGSGEDVFPFPAVWLSPDELLYTSDGLIRKRSLAGAVSPVPTVFAFDVKRSRYRRRVRDFRAGRRGSSKGIVAPVLAPDGKKIAYCAMGALWLHELHSPARKLASGSYLTDPAWSRDGTRLAYVSDRTGSPHIWCYDRAAGTHTQLTTGHGAEYYPAWSPDGRSIAYQDQTYATFVFEPATGTKRRLYPPAFLPGPPTWSPDGRYLAMVVGRPASSRFREGVNHIVVIDVERGTNRWVEPAPGKTLTARGDTGPVWSPDGTALACVMDGQLWLVPVAPDGSPTGTPRRITGETADSPSWSGDSQRLLYLHHGRLKIVGRRGEPLTDIPVRLPWRMAAPSGRTVIRAGAVWDGATDRLRHDIDITLHGNRIEHVGRRQGSARGATVVDASDQVVIPGLIECHGHPGVQWQFYGRRLDLLSLAFGITTYRSTGDSSYRTAEQRDTIDAGVRIGPRFLGSGEALDGVRLLQNVIRATTTPQQATYELDKLLALDSELIKTYVRFPSDLQQLAVAVAHRAGLPVSSHNLYPGAAYGQDEVEHLGSTNRCGYSQAVSELGRGYEDGIGIHIGSRTVVSATLFAETILPDTGFVDDERVVRLLPKWAHDALIAQRQRILSTNQGPARAKLAALVDACLRIHRGGGLVRCGSDFPSEALPSIGFHLSLQALVRWGFTPYEALLTATSVPARSFGLGSQLGRIEPGMLADLAVLRGNPLQDISAAADVSRVVANGVPYEVSDLMNRVPTAVT